MSGTHDDLWTYERFEAGVELGRVEVPLDENRIALWSKVFGRTIPSDGPLPQSMLVAAMMEGSLKAFAPRPKGNIHAMQRLNFGEYEPKKGDVALVRISVLRKEMKRERRWVTLEALISVQDQVAMTGEIILIWAA